MPQVLAAAATWITTEIAIATGVTSLTALTAIAIAVEVAVDVAATVALSAATQALSRPPDPEAGKVTIAQARPVRLYGCGVCRVAFAGYMLREAVDNNLIHVGAFPEGPVDHFGTIWLRDDIVTLGGTGGDKVLAGADNRYPDERVTIQTRLGEDTETAYTLPATYFPTLWDSTSRGDSIPSMMLYARNGKLQDQNWAFPNGEQMGESAEAFYRHYDWRDVGQDREDNTTWTFTDNAIVVAVNNLWRRFGADWDVCFAPVLDDLTIEADYCDDAIPLKAGGTEARYRCGFFFHSTDSAADVMAINLATMDGWWVTRSDGAYVIKAGRFDDPFTTDGGVIFGDAEILDYSFDPGPTAEQVRNSLTVSFTDPANNYSKVETTPWRDTASIAETGEERIRDFYPWGVQANGQVRRLGKRQLARELAPRVSIRTPLSARRGLTKRYIGLRCSECDDLNGVIMEVAEAQIDLATASIVWTGLLIDGAIDEWDEDTEEGDGPIPVERPEGTPFVASPEIVDEDGGAGEANITLRLPLDSSWASVTLYRDTDTGFSGAATVASGIVGGLGEVTVVNDPGLAPDDYFYWARSFDASANASALIGPVGPVTVT